jgi:hypothetical protein
VQSQNIKVDRINPVDNFLNAVYKCERPVLTPSFSDPLVACINLNNSLVGCISSDSGRNRTNADIKNFFKIILRIAQGVILRTSRGVLKDQPSEQLI